ncbi:MAG: methyltransferase domain-containing protein [Balneolaceae bacterium]|nr:methyltransferase domain-containing protein [Balneolaceae bacterium]
MSIKPKITQETVRGLKLVITLLLLFFAAFQTGCAQSHSSDVEWLTESLQLTNGSVVADIGAGEGDEAFAIAEVVGDSGHVYTTELDMEKLEDLKERVERSEWTNITVLKGHSTRTHLPDQCCDAIYMRRVYHHFTEPEPMNRSLYRSLKPGGRLAVIDFEPRGNEADPGGRASGSQHGVTAETVISELSRAGFELETTLDQYGRDYYVLMSKPKEEKSENKE